LLLDLAKWAAFAYKPAARAAMTPAWTCGRRRLSGARWTRS